MRFLGSLVAIAAIVFGSHARASTYDLTYTFRLTDRLSGSPIAGPIDVKVAFFHQETGGDAVHDQMLTGVKLQEGIAQLVVRFTPEDYHEVFPDIATPVWLEIIDLTNAPSQPYTRQRFSMAPYAGKIPVAAATLRFDSRGALTLSSDPVPGKFLKADTNGQLVWSDVSFNAGSTMTLSAGAAATSPLVVQGAAGQSASLQEWRGSNGTPLAAIGSDGALKLSQNGGSHSVALKAPAGLSQSTTYTLPTSPTAGRFLSTDASGNLSWTLPAAGAATSVPATGIEGLTTGSIPFATASGLSEDGAALFWDATNDRLGVGTNTPHSSLQVAGSIATGFRSVNTAHTITVADAFVAVDASSAAVTVTLPSAASIRGRRHTIKKSDSSAHSVTVAAAGGQMIDGAATFVLSRANQTVSVVSDGAGWLIDSTMGMILGNTSSLQLIGTSVNSLVASDALGSLALGVAAATNAILIKASNTVSVLSIESDRVGIGATPASRLEVRGAGTTSATSVLNATKSDGSSVLFVRDDGNVGVNNATPTSTLSIRRNNYNPGVLIENAGYTTQALSVQNSGTAVATITFDGRFTSANGSLLAPAFSFTGDTDTGMLSAGANQLGFVTGGAEQMRILSDGNVVIGAISSTYKLDVNGDINTRSSCYRVAGAAFGGSCSSDERLKTDIEPIQGALEKLAALRPVHFRWRAEDYPELNLGHQREPGLIAQEVEEVFPELVSTGREGFKKVHYGLELQMQTIAGLQELKARGDLAQERLQQLEAENARLRSQTQRLQDYICRKDPEASFCSGD